MVRDNHGKAADGMSYAWVTADFVVELNNAFRMAEDEESLESLPVITGGAPDKSSPPEITAEARGAPGATAQVVLASSGVRTRGTVIS